MSEVALVTELQMLCAILKYFVQVFYYLVHRHSRGQKHIFNWYANIRYSSKLLAMKFVSYVTFVFIDSQLMIKKF